MNLDDYYESRPEDLEESPRDPIFHGAFAGGPPILSQDVARKLFENPEAFDQQAREALERARASVKERPVG